MWQYVRSWAAKFWTILKNSVLGFSDHKIPKLSAALAYTTIFSLAPMLLLIVIVGGAVYGTAAAEGKVFNELKDIIGGDVAIQLQNILQRVHIQKNSTITTVFSAIALVIGSTGIFVEIQDSLNVIWGVRSKSKKGIIKMILNRLISFSMIIGLGFLLIVSLLVNTLLLTTSNIILKHFPMLSINLIEWINNGFIFLVLTFLFAIIFKMLPDVKIKWRSVLMGALLTSALFLIGKFFIFLYISNSAMVSVYGAAGSLIVLLIWIYFSAFILYFGAEVIRAQTEYNGDEILPTKYAEYSDSRLLEEYRKNFNENKISID